MGQSMGGGRPQGSAAVERPQLREGAVGLWGDFIAAVTVDEGEVVDLAYEPSEGTSRWEKFNERAREVRALRAVAASASREGATPGPSGAPGTPRASFQTVVATIWHTTATAVMSPKVMAAPLCLVADATIMPTVPLAQTTRTVIRMAETRPISLARGACT